MRNTHRRGFNMLIMPAFIVMTAFLCEAVLSRSFDAYHAVARAEQDLQALAAAEGAALVLRAGGDPTTLPGMCRCVVGPPAADASRVLTVEVLRNGRPVHTTRWRLPADPGPGQPLLEPLP
jgi:hypothetical protein